MDDEDWDTATVDLAPSGNHRLVGELFWSPDDALAVLGSLTVVPRARRRCLGALAR